MSCTEKREADAALADLNEAIKADATYACAPIIFSIGAPFFAPAGLLLLQ